MFLYDLSLGWMIESSVFHFCYSVNHLFLCQYSLLVGRSNTLSSVMQGSLPVHRPAVGSLWDELQHVPAASVFVQVWRSGRACAPPSAVTPEHPKYKVLQLSLTWLTSACLYHEVAGMLPFLILHALSYNIINLQDIQPEVQYFTPGMFYVSD